MSALALPSEHSDKLAIWEEKSQREAKALCLVPCLAHHLSCPTSSVPLPEATEGEAKFLCSNVTSYLGEKRRRNHIHFTAKFKLERFELLFSF